MDKLSSKNHITENVQKGKPGIKLNYISIYLYAISNIQMEGKVTHIQQTEKNVND